MINQIYLPIHGFFQGICIFGCGRCQHWYIQVVGLLTPNYYAGNKTDSEVFGNFRHD